MRFMVMLKATQQSEAGMWPSDERLAELGKYQEALVHAGVLLAAEGLHPSSKGVRVRVAGPVRTVIEGPFAATTELVAGFWLMQARSREEAVEWVRRCPDVFDGQWEIEIRPVLEPDDRPKPRPYETNR